MCVWYVLFNFRETGFLALKKFQNKILTAIGCLSFKLLWNLNVIAFKPGLPRTREQEVFVSPSLAAEALLMPALGPARLWRVSATKNLLSERSEVWTQCQVMRVEPGTAPTTLHPLLLILPILWRGTHFPHSVSEKTAACMSEWDPRPRCAPHLSLKPNRTSPTMERGSCFNHSEYKLSDKAPAQPYPRWIGKVTVVDRLCVQHTLG